MPWLSKTMLAITRRFRIGTKFTLALSAGMLVLIASMIHLAVSLQEKSLQNLLHTSQSIVGETSRIHESEYNEAEKTNIKSLAELYTKITPGLIQSNDRATLANYTQTAIKDPDISWIAIHDEKQKVLAYAGNINEVSRDAMITRKIFKGKKRIGTVTIGYNYKRMNLAITRNKKLHANNRHNMQLAMKHYLDSSTTQLVQLGLAFLIAAIVITWIVTRFIVRRLRNIMHVMQRYASEEDLNARCPGVRNDELGEVARTFNQLADTIQAGRERDHQNLDELRHAADISDKVDILLDVVSRAAEGDLTGEVTFSGNQTIDHLATAIEQMIDHLNALVQKVQVAGIQVNSTTMEFASNTRDQESAITEQAASTNQIMATVTEISTTARQLVTTMHEVVDVANETAASAAEGHDAVGLMGTTMQHMNTATGSISTKLAILNEKAANISNVVTTINKVADQTNLLSLNAAIEAEKAGEYGRGFAVVATEIRRLADQTAVATWDIEQMVREMQSAVSAGVMSMDKFSEEVTRGVSEVNEVGTRLYNIIKQVQQLTPRFDSVNKGVQMQSGAASQISDSMTQLNITAQQSAESIRHSSESVSTLKDAANKLQNAVSLFKTR